MKKTPVNIDDYKHQLRNHLLSVAPRSDLNHINELIDNFTLKKFSKKQLLIEAGTMSNTMYFIAKGLVRVYYIKEDKEITNLLIPENTLIAGAYSVMTGEKNYSNYEAFEDVHTLKIDYALLESFYAKYHSLEHLGRILAEKYYCAFMKKTFDVLFLSADERYQLFVRDHSDMINRIPLRYIASYLGITQETLSRLRAKY